MHDADIREALAALVKSSLGSGMPVYFGKAHVVPTLPAVFILLVSIQRVQESLKGFAEYYTYRVTYIANATLGGEPSERQALTALEPFLAACHSGIGPGFAGVCRRSDGPIITFEVDVQAEEPLATAAVEYTFEVSRLEGDDA